MAASIDSVNKALPAVDMAMAREGLGQFVHEFFVKGRVLPGIALDASSGSRVPGLNPARQPCRTDTVFSVVNPYSASNPFSRPYPDDFTPPNGSSMPPPAP